MRSPFQVLVIPFRRNDEQIEFCSLQRSDNQAWQAVAGGGEDGDSSYSAAFRETSEELGIDVDVMIKLDTISSIPKQYFSSAATWGSSVYIIPEYSFGVDCTGKQINLSDEHSDLVWSSFEDTYIRYMYDSNKTALWELNERILQSDICFIRR
ncbi:NUDIX domain-containing protein [Pseudomonas poae]|uniref:NUDIX hydrolase n=1 Tax=Pseudomonas TaxID=286 RepID=UPI00081BD5FE|nr:NUDIX domain-containing protein [Pseudomonas sp. 25 E 4]